MSSFSQCQREYDARTPDELDDFECPECGEITVEISKDEWQCPNCWWRMHNPNDGDNQLY